SYPLTIRELLTSGVRRARDQEIVYADKRRLTYPELGERVARLASALAGLGVRRGHTVAMMDWDSNRYLECFFAVPMMGAVLHTVNVRLSAEQVLYTINHAPDDVILVNAEFLPLLQEIWDRVVPGKRLVLMSDNGAAAAGSLPIAGEYEALLAAADPGYAFPALDESTRATTFYTTGTTGLPKGVYFTHRQLVLHTLATTSALAGAGQGCFNDDDVYMPITPMFHVHAWGMPYVATMRGTKQVYPGRYAPDTLLGLIEREKVTFSHCVPTLLEMVLASAKRRSFDLSGWKVIIGGAALPQVVAAQALDAGLDVFAGYGMSETCPILTISRLLPEMATWSRDRQIEVRCRAGRPISLVQIRTVDDAMHDVPRDGLSVGEIVVRAPWLTQGYLHDQASSEKLWAGGWLHTGDIGMIGPDGYLKITDRLKDVIKTGGEWVSSVDLEDMLLQMPQIAEAAVIGVPDPKWSERPLAIVVLRADDTVDTEQVRAHLMGFVSRGLLSKYGVPERVVVVDEIPKTSVGKIDKKVLRQYYTT
ncbi:MAG TPA: fatty acid--CoA ligase, partial [Acetobacteraceae bacterium]|nr:fatty acid--CoA ligase [Acetobacteraceae bacterium]